MLPHYNKTTSHTEHIEPVYENLVNVKFEFDQVLLSDVELASLTKHITSIRGNKFTFTLVTTEDGNVVPLESINKVLGYPFTVTVNFHGRTGTNTNIVKRRMYFTKVKNELDMDYKSAGVKDCVVVAKKFKQFSKSLKYRVN